VYGNNPTDLFYVQDSGKQIYDQKYLIHPAKGTVGTDGYERVVFQKRHYSYEDEKHAHRFADFYLLGTYFNLKHA